MILFDPQGWAVNGRIKAMHFAGLQHGNMTKVAGIIVHQTGSPTAASTIAQYKHSGSNGAHFLIDKDGSIIQTASVLAKVQHVGPVYIRCLMEHRCHPVEMKTVMGFSSYTKARSGGLYEVRNKEVPERYPSNKDAIGIEIVGNALPLPKGANPRDDAPYEQVTQAQNQSLKWLVQELRFNFKVPLSEVFRHPQVSRKDRHEAESAKW